MTKKTWSSIMFAMAMFICLSGFAAAQDDTAATIVGQVTDSAGAAIPNATVVAANTATGQNRQVQTNDEGLYTIYPLIPGEYTVTVEQAGFKRSVTSLTLSTRDRRPVDVILEVGAASETVTVTSEPPLIQDSSVGQTLVSGNQVTELPLNNRNFIRLLETIPGVSSDLDDESNFGLTSRASVSINGQRRNSVNYVVDGVSNVDIGSNITLLSTPTVDSIQEFKVLSSNYTADIGRSGGGSVVITTKGGGNDFHGTLYEFARNDYFNANSFFNNRIPRRPDGSIVAPTPKLRYHNFGGVISGPVFFPNFGDGGPDWLYNGRNKTFFFFSEEVRRITRATTNAGATVPTAAQRTGNFSANLGNLICRNGAGTFVTSTSATACSTAGTSPVVLTDTSGATINLQQGQIFRPDNVPFAQNTIPLALIDPRALGLLEAYPLPNSGINSFTASQININNTRQETFRVDHNFNDNHKIFGRYTMDTSDTTEFGGLFTNQVLPGVATTATKVPGKVLAVAYTGLFGANIVNEFQFNFSANEIRSDVTGRGRRSDYAGANLIQEFYPENNQNIIPSITGTGFSTIGALQGYSIEYASTGFRDVMSWTKGNHLVKFGGEMTWEIKNENAGSNSHGLFGYSTLQSRGFVGAAPITATGVVTGNAFASYLLNRANSYSEAATDFRVNERFGRREFFVQDTWKVRPNLTLDLGVRYQFFVPVTDKNNQIGTFDPDLYNPANSVCTTTACTALNLALSDPNNGYSLAGSTSPFGRKVHPADYNNFSPRVGIAWDPFSDGKTIVRSGYGFYYDQALIGIFEQAAFLTPAFNPSVSFTSTPTSIITFDDVDAGAAPGTLPLRGTVFGIANDFETPEIQQFSVGVQREVFKNAVIDVSYVRTKGDKLIRQRNINFVTPAAVVASGTTSGSSVRPFKGYQAITYRETSAKSRYAGLLSSFIYRLEKGFTISLAYTLSKAMTDSTNDRDAVDDPQNPFDLAPEYAEARTSRRHIFSASYVYEIPFFTKSESSAARLLLGGWQVSGITQIESGAPVPRVTIADTLNQSRGLYPNISGDVNGGLTGTVDPVTGLPFIFDPTVFSPAAAGTFGDSRRSFARLPGRNQTNLALMKQFYFNTERNFYLQLRAESFNLFNQTQFTGIGTTLPTAGALSAGATIGRPTATRLPREFQFGVKLYF